MALSRPQAIFFAFLSLLSCRSVSAATSNAAILKPSGFSGDPIPVYAFFNQSLIPSRGGGEITGIVSYMEPFDACGVTLPREFRVVGGQSAAASARTVAVSIGNCTVAEKLATAQNAVTRDGGSLAALLVEWTADGVLAMRNESRAAVNGTYTDGGAVMRTPIFIVFKEDLDFAKEKYLGKVTDIHLYSSPSFDPAAIILVSLAVLTLFIGSRVSAKSHPVTAKLERIIQGWDAPPGEGAREPAAKDNEEEEGMGVFTWITAVVFICVAAGGLLLFFFFPNVVVYVVIAIFCLSGSFAIATLLSLFALTSISRHVPHLKRHLFTLADFLVTLGDVACFAVGVATAAWWFAVRKGSYAWVLQDIIGVCFMVQVLRQVALPNLKVATILLCLAFFYDIFFVFITPLFTSSGTSIMETVALGGNTGESVPLLLVAPRLLDEFAGQSLLGFGDVVVPGLCIMFVVAVDAATKRLGEYVGSGRVGVQRSVAGDGASVADGRSSGSTSNSRDALVDAAVPSGTGTGLRASSANRRSTGSMAIGTSGVEVGEQGVRGGRRGRTVRKSHYFPVAIVGYVLGLAVTFVAVGLMRRGQPALLYLMPSVLGSIYVYAWTRGEVSMLWRGDVAETLAARAEKEGGVSNV